MNEQAIDCQCWSCKEWVAEKEVTENDGDCPSCGSEMIEGLREVACCGCGNKYGIPNHDGDGRYYCGGQFCCP